MKLSQRLNDAIEVIRGVKVAIDTEPSSGVQTGNTGAAFGQAIADVDRLWVVGREPIAYRIVYKVAQDITDKWFTVEDLAKNPDENLDEVVQKALVELDAKSVLTEAIAFERLFGWSVIALGFRDGGELNQPARKGMPLEELALYDPLDVANIVEDQNPDSERFGLPEQYCMQRGSVQTYFHHSRTIHLATRLLDHRYKGLSALDPVWDDLTCLRNIRWGLAQTIFRYGSGFPDITIEGATKEQIDNFTASGVFKNVHARTYFVHNEKQRMDFKGVEGSALNPSSYYEPILENISVGSSIPKAILRGAQAGALAGSEVNQAEYYKFISDQESLYEPSIRQIIDLLIESGQVKTSTENYAIRWGSGFQHSDQELAQILVLNEQAQQIRTNYMTINEIRARSDPPLDPLPDPEGSIVIGVSRMNAPKQEPSSMNLGPQIGK